MPRWSDGIVDLTVAEHGRRLGQVRRSRRDLDCAAAHGTSVGDEVAVTGSDEVATASLFQLVARSQEKATVPMIDVRAHARWLHVDVVR